MDFSEDSHVRVACVFPPRSSFLSGSADVSAELFSELLTINLLKLEKVGSL